ncbi:MAG: Zn-dependent exopeptidase M28 [Proteobacteria bacterium]|nr:Zn-dependent exopeptidase M28 [Pseudomonadota bacterium]MCP4918542.1 Zn-dependent exopeptidase M28 [Pseudomonadota bacterium]
MTWLVGLAAADPLPGPDPPAVTLAARVYRARVQDTLELLTGEQDLDGSPIASRNIHHADIARVEAWLQASMGAKRQEFRAERTDCANLIRVIEGTEPDLEPVLIGAHYDSTAELTEGYDPKTSDAPGADDNASGVAVLVEAANVLGGWEGTFRRSIHLVAFSAEEQGLKGSIHYVDELTRPVHMALILDPVGHNPGDWLFVAFDARWEDAARELEATAEQLVLRLEVGPVDHETFGGDERSDHAPFWWAEMPALHAGSFPLPPAYHTEDDTLDGVDVDFVHEVAQLSVAHAANLAGATAPVVEEEPGLCATGALPTVGLGILLSLVVLRRRSG